MHPQALQLTETFKRDFFSADRSIRWTAAEETKTLWLSPNTVLVGTIDAQGITEDGRPFFVDFKTMGVRKAGKNNANMPQVKAEWKMDPQALCYGLLMGDACRSFTVRWLIKSSPPTTDFEWYTYTANELAWWKQELLREADGIRALRYVDSRPYTNYSEIRLTKNWPTNLTNCTRYGWNYRCPLYDHGCTKLDFVSRPAGVGPRDHHVADEAALLAAFKGDPRDLVVLSSSSIEMWLGCQEKYRRFYEDGEGMNESGEALTVGTDSHTIIADHIRTLITSQETK